jgi:hypothetical protein
MRILRHEQALQFEFLGCEARCEIREFLFAHGGRGGVLVGGQGAGKAQIFLERHEAPITFDQRPQPRVFHRQFTKLVLARNDARIRQQAADFLEPLVQFFELAPDGVFHGGGIIAAKNSTPVAFFGQ